MNNNYQEMWKQLKEKLEQLKKSYAKGTMMSMAESVHGELCMKEILELMKKLEGKF